MSSMAEHDPLHPDDPGTPAETPSADPQPEESWPLLTQPAVFQSPFEEAETLQEQPAAEAPLFQSWSRPEFFPPARIPHLGHLLLLLVLALFGLLGAALLTRSALHFHLFGISTPQQAADDIHYALGFQVANYLIAFCACLLVFPLVWQKSFMAGLQWNGATALRLRRRLFSAALLCVVLAIADGLLFQAHNDTPIDKIFRAPGAAWLLFAFGVTCAPFFEEIVFRGFLLPGLCTAWDWAIERSTGKPALPLDAEGHPQWSLFAMAVASVFTSIPFALMHGEQNGYALGPFLLLLCVSLVLCWARLSTRSLAASVLVHASYNFLLFSFMLLGTGGFKHLDKM
ncbi:MAG: CPBP family intramembrane glutamic endopeptidase [Terracidiphilus sp.]|jgi:membrane protease YdiL (CAAX protease family)